MKNSKLLLTSLIAAATMGTSAYAGFVWNGGETITQELWQTQSSWTLTDGTTWTGVGTGPQTPDSNAWDSVTVANASGTVDSFEGWEIGLTLQNANLTVTNLKKFQGGCTLNLDAASVLSMTLNGNGNFGGNVTVNTEGVFNLALGRTYDGDGFIANLGSTGIFNISGAYPAKVSSISAKLGNGSSDVLLSIIGGNTVYTRNLVTLSDGATLSNSATYSFTDASDNVLTAVASFGDLDFSKYYAVKDASGYSVSYLVSGISDEVYRWQATGDSSVWSAAVWTKGETTGQNITSDGIAYFGAGDGLASTVTIDAATTVGRLIVDADYTFNGSNYLAMTSGGVVNAGATLILEKSGDGNGGFLRGEIEVAGTLQLDNKDVTGYSGTRENNLHTITVDAGGVLKLNHSENETFLGTLNLNGTLSGKDADTRWDMYDGNSEIVVAAGANALIDENVKLVIRRNNAPIFVGKDATLTIDGQVLKASLVGQESTWNGVLVKNGAGTLTLNGNVDVTGVTVSAGTLTLNGTVNVTGVTQNAGTLNISGAATIGAVSQTDGTLNFTGANATIASYMGPTYAGGGTNPVTNVGAGANLNVSGEFYLRYEGNGMSTLNVDGDMVVGGALNLSRDGKGIVNVRDGGTLVAASIGFGQNWSGTSKSSEINLASGGTLVAGAMTKLCNNINSSSLNLNGGVLGTNAESLTISVDSLPIVLGTGTTSTINTGKYDTATKTFTDTGAAISIANVISGDGALKKTGAGTLTLGGANTSYSGQTTIEGGVLVAGNASALGAGNVVVENGATLARGLTSGPVAIGGTLTTNGAAILSTGALNAGTAAFAVTGDVTLSAGTIFDVGSLVDGKLVSSAGTLTIADSGTLTKANFLLNGGSLGSRTTFDISTSGNAVTISNVQKTALTLTWFKSDPSGSAVWSNGCSGWSYHEGGSSRPSYDETFQTGDSVIFSDDSPVVKNVVVDGVVSVGTMTIDSDADFAFSGQNGAAITSSGALTKRGTRTATIDASVDLSRIGGGIVVEENGGKLVVDTASGYAGAVTAGPNGTFTLNVSSDTTLANTLSGVGTFEKTGAGTLTVSTANADLAGQFVISEGTVKLGSAGSDLFGEQSNTEANKNRYAVQVSSGGTLDMNGQNDISYRVTLSGGSLVNNGNDIGEAKRQLYGIQLTADSEIGGSNKFGLLASMYDESRLDLGAHTLTKTGSNVFMLVSTAVTAGNINVEGGTLWLANGKKDNEDKLFSMNSDTWIKLDGGTIEAGRVNGASMSVALGNVAIVLKDTTTQHILANTENANGTNATFTVAEGAKLYLDIGALTETVLTGEQVALTIAAASAIANDSFFSAVEVGTYVDDVWQISSDWKYLAYSWSASAGTLTITAIPEPSMFGLMAGLGALALAGTRRRRKKA